MNRIEFIIL